MLVNKIQAPSSLGLDTLVEACSVFWNLRARTWCRSSGTLWCPKNRISQITGTQRQQQYLFAPSSVPRDGLLYIFPRAQQTEQ